MNPDTTATGALLETGKSLGSLGLLIVTAIPPLLAALARLKTVPFPNKLAGWVNLFAGAGLGAALLPPEVPFGPISVPSSALGAIMAAGAGYLIGFIKATREYLASKRTGGN